MEDSIRRVFSHPRPLCPRCKIRTSIFRIQPQDDGSEVWSFECPGCYDIFTETTGKFVGVSAR
jgi:transposase-like protein